MRELKSEIQIHPLTTFELDWKLLLVLSLYARNCSVLAMRSARTRLFPNSLRIFLATCLGFNPSANPWTILSATAWPASPTNSFNKSLSGLPSCRNPTRSVRASTANRLKVKPAPTGGVPSPSRINCSECICACSTK